MVDLGTTIDNLELNIRWIEDIPAHQFPGWGNTTAAMRDAVELLKEQDEQIEKLEYDLAVTKDNLMYYVNGND